MIRTYDEFVDLLNEKGFLLLTGRDYLSVEQVTDIDNWYTDTPLDPWSWKDKLATRRDGAYSHMFAGQCGFISRGWFPMFYAAYSIDIYDEYDAELVPKLAMNMWELFEERPVWGRPDLRHALTGRYEKKSEFESALKYLERAMLTTISGQVQPVSMLGKPMGWPALEYSRTDTYLADWLEGGEQDAAKARQIIRARAEENFPALKKSACARYFGRD